MEKHNSDLVKTNLLKRSLLIYIMGIFTRFFHITEILAAIISIRRQTSAFVILQRGILAVRYQILYVGVEYRFISVLKQERNMFQQHFTSCDVHRVYCKK